MAIRLLKHVQYGKTHLHIQKLCRYEQLN